MSRDPLTPDCGVHGCKRAAYSLGLCRTHRKLAPFDLGIRCSVETARAGYAIGRKYAEEAIAQVHAALEREAKSSNIGTAA